MAGREKTDNYLAILGVKDGASLQELKRAFRRKVAVLHPDINPGDPIAAEAFKRVTAAYEYLKSRAREEKPQQVKETSITQAPRTAHRAPPYAARAAKAPPLPLDELLLRLRYSQNVYVRIHAVRAIETLGAKEGAWALVQALDDSDRRVVSEAVAATGKLRARIAALPLIQLHKKSPPALQRQIEWALEQLDSPISQKYLLKTVGKSDRRDRQDAEAGNNSQIA